MADIGCSFREVYEFIHSLVKADLLTHTEAMDMPLNDLRDMASVEAAHQRAMRARRR